MLDYGLVPLGGQYNYMECKVDVEDLDLVREYSWYGVFLVRDQSVRVRATAPIGSHSRPVMARLLMNVLDNPDVVVDHKNHDTLDNRRCNLRVCERWQNLQNNASRGGSSKYNGVSWNKLNRNWRVQICVNYRRIHVGSFKSEFNAALAYDKAARKHFGEFACTNFRS